MGKPAAKLGSMTAHGGSVVLGNPTVMVGKMPAACMGDMHVCPLVTGVVPHVGGPIILGSVGVLIGGRPAARMGDMVTCVGPPDTIVMGVPNVMIGEISPAPGGAGSGGGGAGGAAGAAFALVMAVGSAAAAVAKALKMSLGSSAAAAACSAQAATMGGSSETAEGGTQAGHWIKFQFLDKAGLPVVGVPYLYKSVDGTETRSTLTAGGMIFEQGIDSGNCSVRLLSLSDAKWSVEEAKTDEEVTMSVAADGLKDKGPAEFKIFKRDLRGPDLPMGTVAAKVQGDKIEAKWKYPEAGGDSDGGDSPAGYSRPEFFFVAEAESCRARSGMLRFKDWVEVEVKDEEGNVLADEECRLVLASGEIRSLTTDKKGRLRVEDVPPGPVHVELPRFPGAGKS
jgi:uncharacterized Zn-binding protein involved in type VI secretion